MSKKIKDPFFDKEKAKYSHPIPSREWIMQTLEDFGRPMSKQHLFNKLEIGSDTEQEALGFRLKAMLRDGQLMQDRRGRFCLLGRINLIRGSIQGHPDGYGFFIPDSGGVDMVLSATEMRSVMHGDKVLAYESGVDRRGRPEAKIHEVIEHANASVVGRFFSKHGVGFVIPDNKRLTQDISIPLESSQGAKNNQIVLTELLVYPSKRNQAIGRITEILGEHMAPGMEIEVAIHTHGIPAHWPEDVSQELEAIPKKVSHQDCQGRMDLRELPFVTIDGEDAKDFDDAVYCYAKPKGGFLLYVAIADVSHYVPIGSALDKEANLRGNSVYFPGKVVPMLPEPLSNGICSLNPAVDRLCIVAELNISSEGKMGRYRFYRAVFRSQARLTYTEVANWLKEDQAPETKASFWPSIQNLYKLYKALAKTRQDRGAMDFESTETYIEFDADRKIQRMLPLIRNDAHRLIEECMLAANVAAAKFLAKAKIPVLYRVHTLPEEGKIETLREFLSEFGLRLGGGKKPQPKDFQKILSSLDGQTEKHLIETVILRSLKQAQYVEENQGHFGLAYAAYTHFTSPIRRYPDLLIHRAIGHLIDNKNPEDFSYTHNEMGRLGKHCSMTERRADEASRDVVAWLKCEYMQDKLGQVFSGRISAVTSFGLFVALEEVYVEGLVHITSLKSDYYNFDALRHRLVGARSGYSYHLGDPLKVIVARVDLDERKIDFELADRDKTHD